MKIECYPVSVLPHPSRLFLDYVERREALTPFFPVAPFSGVSNFPVSALPLEARAASAALLASQTDPANNAALANIERLRQGASAIVTGQQVGLFGGPLLTLLKAATAIRLAKDLSTAGKPHVPIFRMATENHDFA